nr:hypothetical protein [Escherichia coli]
LVAMMNYWLRCFPLRSRQSLLDGHCRYTRCAWLYIGLCGIRAASQSWEDCVMEAPYGRPDTHLPRE